MGGDVAASLLRPSCMEVSEVRTRSTQYALLPAAGKGQVVKKLVVHSVLCFERERLTVAASWEASSSCESAALYALAVATVERRRWWRSTEERVAPGCEQRPGE